MSLFRGSGVAVVTPFTSDNHVDFEQLGHLIEWQIANKTDAIIVCGTTGEAPTLKDEEHMEVIRYAVQKVAGRIQVIAGTGSNYTEHAIEMSQFAESVGVDGVLCVSPYYNKSTQNGLIKHFTAIADSISIPMILYNIPGRTGINIEPSTIHALSKHPMIQGIKEASGSINQMVEIARLVPDDFRIYSGNDEMIIPMMSLKGDGVISVVANIMPLETHNMIEFYIDGKHDAALQLQLDMKPLIDALFCEVNPIPVKTALNLMGFNVGGLRAPLYDMEDQNKARLIREMNVFNLIKE